MLSFWGKSARLCILVVDSDLEAAGRLSEVITGYSSGYDVLSACSGSEGVQKIENGVVNIVLAAEDLVDMTGTTFFHILQSLKKPKKNGPACVLMADTIKRGKTTEIDDAALFDVIRCPVDAQELAYVLDLAMDLDVLNGKIEFNVFVGRVLVALIPVAIVVGVVLGKW